MKTQNQTSAAPAQAQHSPLPWKFWNGAVFDLNGKVVNGDVNIKFSVRACNNAQRLADALKLVLIAHDTLSEQIPYGKKRKTANTAMIANGGQYGYGTKAIEALAEWSKKK